MLRPWAFAATLLAPHAAFADPLLSESPSLLQIKASIGRDTGEGPAVPPDVAEKTMKALDTDGDGYVGPDEIVNFAKMLHIDGSRAANDLKELDVDGDGRLNSQELMKVLQAAGPLPSSATPVAKAAPTAPAAPRAAAVAQQASAFPSDVAQRTMKALDTNGDGVVGPEEITKFASMLHIDGSKAASDLKELDADGDGKLNVNELMKVLQGANMESPANSRAVQAAQAPRPPPPAPPPIPSASVAPQKAGAGPNPTPKAIAAPLAAAQVQATVPGNAAASSPPARPTGTTTPQKGASSVASAAVSFGARAPPIAPVTPAVARAALGAAAVAGASAAVAGEPAILQQTMAVSEPQGAADPSAVQLADLLVSTRGDEDGAMSLEGVAEELNANSTLIARKAMSAAQQAAAQAAQTAAAQIMQQFKALQQQAEQAEIEAATLRAKARIELQSATLATLIAEKALEKPASAGEL